MTRREIKRQREICGDNPFENIAAGIATVVLIVVIMALTFIGG